MKRTIVKNIFLFLSLTSLITLASCEKDNPPGGGGKDPEVNLCTTYGTFTRVLCGVSIYNNYWIRTDDGRYLQPCATDIVTICPLPIREGTRVKFGYKKLTGKSQCDEIVTCQAFDARMTGSQKVRITCIEIISQAPDTIPCSFTGTIAIHTNTENNCSVRTIVGDNGITIEPQDQDKVALYTAGTRVVYGYSEVATLVVTCSGARGAVLDCIRSEN